MFKFSNIDDLQNSKANYMIIFILYKFRRSGDSGCE